LILLKSDGEKNCKKNMKINLDPFDMMLDLINIVLIKKSYEVNYYIFLFLFLFFLPCILYPYNNSMVQPLSYSYRKRRDYVTPNVKCKKSRGLLPKSHTRILGSAVTKVRTLNTAYYTLCYSRLYAKINTYRWVLYYTLKARSFHFDRIICILEKTNTIP